MRALESHIVAGAIAAVIGAAMGACNKPPAAAPGYRALIKATDIDGTQVGVPTGKRATLVVFFATWCQPCRNELATLSQLRQRHADVRILGVNAYEEWNNLSDAKRLRTFLQRNARWLRVIRADKALFRAFGGVPKIPSVFVFDERGRLVKAFRRSQRPPPSRAELERTLSELATRT